MTRIALALVHRTEVEVARFVVGVGRRNAVLRLEEEELGQDKLHFLIFVFSPRTKCIIFKPIPEK